MASTMGHQWSAGGANRGALLHIFLAFCFAAAILTSRAGALGVIYGKDAYDFASPAVVLKLIQKAPISTVKLSDANPEVLTAFAGTGIEVVISAGNDQIQPMSASPSYAAQWVQTNVAAYPKTSIVMIALGNEVLPYSEELMPLLLPAFQNLHTALVSAGYGETVKLSTPSSLDILAKSFPPSHSVFHDGLAQVLDPLLNFFAQTGSRFMVNIYPYSAYATSPANIPLDYALLRSSAAAVYDDGSGLYYHNLFDAQVDAIHAAISKLGYNNIDLVVSETGWPFAGKANEAAATLENAQTYNENLIEHLVSGVGTPAKPNVTAETFIIALHDENLKWGPESERNVELYSDRRFLTGLWYSPPPPVTVYWPPPPVTVYYPPPITVFYPPPITVSYPPPITVTYPPPITVTYPPPPTIGAQPPPLIPYYPPETPPVTEPPVASYPPPPVIVQIPPPPPPVATSPSPPPVVYPPPIGVYNPPPPATIYYPPPPTLATPPSPPPPATVYPPSPPLAPYVYWPPPPVIVLPPPPPTPALPPISTPPLAPWPPPPVPVIGYPPPAPPAPALTPIYTPPLAPWSPPPPLPWSPPPPALGPITPPVAPWPAGPPTAPVPPGVASWCVANPTADPNQLQVALDWACSAGGADCSAIQPGAACYNPNTLVAHASYAFDSYYTNNNRSSWDCYFAATANLTTVNPSYTNCTYP